VPRVKVVVFDVGETLVDETRAWTQRADEAGVTPLTLVGALGALIARGEDHRHVWKLLGVQPPVGLVSIRASDLYPDAVPCLRLLGERGYRIGLAGNQPAIAEEQLWQLGLSVDLIASSARWGVEKPDPAFFTRICEEADAQPSEIAYVGDRVDNDVAPAKDAGMFAVFIRRGPWGYIQAQLPDNARLADAQIDSLAELPVLLEG
jgi:HAD superfamily hydrolase (TIGR01509 family)